MIYKWSKVLPVNKNLWEDELAICLDNGWIELLPDVKFEDCWDLWKENKPFMKELVGPR